MSRLMSVEAFGEVQVLFSIFLQVGIVLITFGLIVVNIVTNTQSDVERKYLLSELYTLSLYILIPILLLFVVLTPFLTNVLKFSSALPLLALAILLLTNIPMTLQRFYFQGAQDFVAVSWANIIVAIGRLVFGVAIILLGTAAGGAIAGFALANLFAIYFLYRRFQKGFPFGIIRRIRFETIKRELLYGGLILIATGFITLLHTADVVLVKSFFSPQTAGYYAGISTIAKIILFATGAVSAVLLSSIRIANGFPTNNQKFLKGLALIVCLGGLVLLFFTFFPKFITSLLLGERYLELASLLPKLSLVIFIISIVNMFFYYFIALRSYRLIPISLIGILAITGLVFLNHESPGHVINAFLYGSLITLALVLGLYASQFKELRTRGAIYANTPPTHPR